MNKRKRKKQLKNNREELRQNLLKLEEATEYFKSKGAYALHKSPSEQWEIAFLTNNLTKLSRETNLPRTIFEPREEYVKSGIQTSVALLFTLDDKENKNDI